MTSIIDKKFVEELLTNRIEEVIERQSLEKKLLSGKKLVIKLGADPSRPDLHLGHAVILRKLKELQDLGHKAVFIIGDFTAMIGDPSGRTAGREPLTPEEVRKNAKTYLNQVGKILDLKKAEIRYNSEWFSKMDLVSFFPIAANFSLRRIMDREDFQKRIKSGGEVGVHEGLYQVLQAYDSVVIKADVELGGRDQLINLLAGRELQKKMGHIPQDIIIAPLLVGLDGKHKMSKSFKNYISLTESAEEIFGKVMSIPDSLTLHYADLAAFMDKNELEKVGKLIKQSPMQAKRVVAGRIVQRYLGDKQAEKALQAFEARFSKRGKNDEAYEEKAIQGKTQTLVDVVFILGGLRSRSEARRLIAGRGVEIDGKVISNPLEVIDFTKPHRFRIGKKKFIRAIPN